MAMVQMIPNYNEIVKPRFATQTQSWKFGRRFKFCEPTPLGPQTWRQQLTLFQRVKIASYYKLDINDEPQAKTIMCTTNWPDTSYAKKIEPRKCNGYYNNLKRKGHQDPPIKT
jgi:hypothetical protein